MEITYDPSRRILRITPRGPWPSAETHRVARSVLDDLDLDPGAGVLIDLRKVEGGSAPSYQEISLRSRRSTRALPKRRAYLVRPGAQFGIARQIQGFARDDLTIEVFIEEDEAVAWLNGEASW